MIGELADIAGVTSQTVRFYERRGLLPDAERGANGYRVYDEAMLARLRFINVAQAAGLTLSEIRSIIHLRDEGDAPCEHVVTLIHTISREMFYRCGNAFFLCCFNVSFSFESLSISAIRAFTACSSGSGVTLGCGVTVTLG